MSHPRQVSQSQQNSQQNNAVQQKENGSNLSDVTGTPLSHPLPSLQQIVLSQSHNSALSQPSISINNNQYVTIMVSNDKLIKKDTPNFNKNPGHLSSSPVKEERKSPSFKNEPEIDGLIQTRIPSNLNQNCEVDLNLNGMGQWDKNLCRSCKSIGDFRESDSVDGF